MNFVIEHYMQKNEDTRFNTKHGRVEYITTKKYIDKFVCPTDKIIEIGAGTGAYSIWLAYKCCDVTAIDLLQQHIDIIRNKAELMDVYVKAEVGNALNLKYNDNTFDITLLLGPMYHLFKPAEQITALSEAKRITKPNGLIFIAYCLEDATIFNFLFKEGYIKDYKDHIREDNYSLISNEKDIFNLYRIEDIDKLYAKVHLQPINRIATDGLTNYAKAEIDNMPDDIYNEYIKYHLATCERADRLGVSHHLLDIIRKPIM